MENQRYYNPIPILWNEKTQKLESEDRFIENHGFDLNRDILIRVARYLDTYPFCLKVLRDDKEVLQVQVQDASFDITFKKKELPKILNEPIFFNA